MMKKVTFLGFFPSVSKLYIPLLLIFPIFFLPVFKNIFYFSVFFPYRILLNYFYFVVISMLSFKKNFFIISLMEIFEEKKSLNLHFSLNILGNIETHKYARKLILICLIIFHF